MFQGNEGLRNGFVEVAQLDKHNLSILGLRALLWSADPTSEYSRTRKLILSWDEKNIILWEHGKLLRQLKLGSFDGRGISAMAYVSTLRVFVAATFNMTFVFYDYSLKVLDTVSHDERMVTDIEYDIKGANLVISGSGGMSRLRSPSSLHVICGDVSYRPLGMESNQKTNGEKKFLYLGESICISRFF